MNDLAKRIAELEIELIAIKAELEKPAPPQDGPTEVNLGWMWWHVGAEPCGNSCVADLAHTNGLWAPTREECEALGSRLIMQAKRGPMPKECEWCVRATLDGRIEPVQFGAHSPMPNYAYWLGLLRIDSPENRAELEQTLRLHGRGYGIEVGS